MKLICKGEYLSIKHIDPITLPDLTIITGINGSGKTNLLEAIIRGKVIISDIPALSQKLNRIYRPFGQPFIERGAQAMHSQNQARLSSIKTMLNIHYRRLIEEINKPNGIIRQLEGFQKQGKIYPDNFNDIERLHYGSYYQVMKITGKALSELKEEDFLFFAPLRNVSPWINHDLGMNLYDYFIFYSFRKFINDRNKKLRKQGNKEVICLDEALFKEVNGNIPPWEFINNIMPELDLNFKFVHNIVEFDDTSEDLLSSSIDRLFKCNFNLIGGENDLKGLSSGEKVMIGLAELLFFDRINEPIFNEDKLLLLDEFDASLHPSWSKLLIEQLQKKPLSNYKIIMTTHSPSTIAYAPEESIYVMSKEQPRLQKENRADAIKKLSSGLINLSNEEAEFDLHYNIDNFAFSKNMILCTEGKTDKVILESAWKKLFNQEKKDMPFYILDCFDKNFLYKIFSDATSGIFIKNPNKLFVSLFDFDSAFGDWENFSNNWSRTQNPEIKCHCKQFKQDKKYSLLLPIPGFRNNIASEILGINSQLSIELLFENKFIPKKYMKCQNHSSNEFSKGVGTKNEFAKSTENFPGDAFVHFKPLFETLLYIKKIHT